MEAIRNARALDKASIRFDPAKDMPPLDGKVILVTGGNNGLGKHSVCEYARHNPKQIWLGARNLAAAQAVVDEIHKAKPSAPVKVLEMDLASFSSIKKAAQTFLASSDRLDILMLNAGIMAAAPALTEDGYELQFGTNHMGHALLTKLLLPTMEKTAQLPNSDVRIVALSSGGHRLCPKEGINFASLKTTADSIKTFERYGQSKLANVLFARHLAKRYPQFTVASVHPGVVKTNLGNSATSIPAVVRAISSPILGWFLAPVDQGAKNQLWAAASKDVKSGEYYEPVGVPNKTSRHGKDDDLAKDFWDWTAEELKSWSV